MVLKFDMSEVYDRVEWVYLRETMFVMGFYYRVDWDGNEVCFFGYIFFFD